MTFRFKLSRRLSMSFCSILSVLSLAGTMSCEHTPVNSSFANNDLEIVRVTSQPAVASLNPSEDQAFSALGITQSGQAVPIPVTWSASAGTIDTTGHFTAPDEAGEYEVVARHSIRTWLSDTSLVMVQSVSNGDDVASVDMIPTSGQVALGETAQFTAIPRSLTGEALSGVSVVWASEDDGIASIDQTGIVTGEALGTTTISATAGTITATASVTVTDVSVSSVVVTPPTADINQGETVQLTAEARDADGNTLPGRPIAWTSSNANIATVSPTGLATGTGSGTTTIRATSEGVQGTASITVTFVPVASVTVTPGSPSINVGENVVLTATPRDAAGNPLSGRPVTWTSQNPSVASVNQNGRVTGQSSGTTTVMATSEGVDGTATVSVSEALVASVDVTPSSASVFVDETVQLSATPRDADGNALAGRSVSWSSSAQSVASVSNQGLVTANAEGTATITATVEGVDGTSTITVSLQGSNPTPNVLNNESFESNWGPFSDGGSGNPGGQGQVFARRQDPPAGVPSGGTWAARLDFSPSGQDGGSNMTLDWVGEGLGPTTQNFWFRCYQYHTNSNNSILKNLRFMNNSGNLVGSLYSTSGFSWDFGIGSSPTSVPGFVLNQWMELEIHYQMTGSQRIVEFWINGVKSTRPDGPAGGDEGAYWSNGRLMVNRSGSSVRGVFLLNTLNGGNSRSGSIWLDRCAVSTAGRIGQ